MKDTLFMLVVLCILVFCTIIQGVREDNKKNKGYVLGKEINGEYRWFIEEENWTKYLENATIFYHEEEVTKYANENNFITDYPSAKLMVRNDNRE